MKIQYVSDLHLEFKNNRDGLIHLDKDAEVLVIAGDLAVGPKIFDYLIELAKDREVVFVYGNHEFYDNKPIRELKKKGHFVSKYNKNLHILDKDSVVIGDTTFIGATGWPDGSFMNIDSEAFKNYNDFHMIQDFATLHKNWGHEDKLFIKKAISTSKTKHNIVVTHFLPLVSCITKKYAHDPYNPCFTNSWVWIYDYSDKIDYWIHGHSHEFLKKDIGDVIFCRNPFGYPNEGVNFQPNEFIIIN